MNTKPGLFEIAGEGTLFLDEIGEMELTVQARLLKALEEKRFRRVGGTARPARRLPPDRGHESRSRRRRSRRDASAVISTTA